ncbi:MAG: hypothetical protein NZ730_09020 [Porticoccaceae bacterium]|nr:hypothetical protein [Porticoccaceae bacterium]
MGLVSKNIPNLINGVSQQPPALRLESQGEVQENGFSDVVDGLKKRPPTEFLNRLLKANTAWVGDGGTGGTGGSLNAAKTEPLSTNDLEIAVFHTYKRSDDEQFLLVITTDALYVYDVEGNLRYQSGKGSWLADGTWIVDNSDAVDYLLGYLTCTSVADATFIVNKDKTVELSDVLSPASDLHQTLVYLKSVNYGRDYTLSLKSKTTSENFSVSSSTPDQITTVDSSTDDQTINSEGLKVSQVIGFTEVGSTRTNLRTLVENELGTLIEEELYDEDNTDWQTVATLPTSLRTLTEPPSLDLSAWLVADAETRNLVYMSFNGRDLPYDADGIVGWKLDPADSEKFILPTFMFSKTSRWAGRSRIYRWERPELSIKEFTQATSGYLEPRTYQNEPYFVITCPDSQDIKDFNIVVTDDDGGVNLKAFKDTAKSFTDLPNQCIDGFRLGVVGDNQKKEDDFHVVFTGGAGSGYWKETVAYNLANYYDLDTMPHTLKQNADLSFTFGHGSDNEGNSWQERKAGDDHTNPQPSFVGKKITDIFFHRNRLGILADENVVFSEASQYFNFWRTTVRSLLDSDPIDVAVSQNEVSVLQAAVPIQDNLLLFSELNQFTLSSAQLLTPTEVTIDQSTKYECDLTASPVGAGTSVFFATKSGEYAGIREFFTKEESEVKDAVNVTSHVPKYLYGGVRKMVASSNEDMLVCLTSGVKSECYVYKWYNSSEERLQSSWSKWTFDKDILDVSFSNAEIYFVFSDGSFEKMSLSLDADKLLDHKVVITSATPEHYAPSPKAVAITKEGETLGAYGSEAPRVVDYLATVGAELTIGVPYTFKYQLSEQVFKPTQGDSTKLARFQLRKVAFNYSNTGHFDVAVQSVGRDAVTSTFTGRILGQSENLLDQSAVVDDGSFQVGVQSQANRTDITITNDTHLPCIFQSAEWEGFVTLRNQRL